MPRSSKNELRCFCARSPLLATYGIDSKGSLYVHVKIFKQRRIFGEMIVTGGTVKIHCRECFRWHSVIIRQPGAAVLKEEPSPPEEAKDH
jgi:hypothetical protein